MALQIQPPGLKYQIDQSPLTARAWTYQEAILSPRCLYFTSDQIYFECNLFQSCESIDTVMSPRHNVTSSELVYRARESVGKSQDMHYLLLNSGIHRSFSAWPLFRDHLVHSEVTQSGMWRLYSKLVKNYSRKALTYDSDALNAISAILAKLQESQIYPDGFHWGLPLDQFEGGLTWSCSSDLIRREGFPSWSWLGWKGHINFEDGCLRTNATPPQLSAWKICSGKFERLFPGSYFRNNGQVPQAMLEEPVMCPWLSDLDTVEASRLLVAKGYVLLLPILKPFRSDEMKIRIPLFGRVFELLCSNNSTVSKIMALGREGSEDLCVLRLNIPAPSGSMPALVLLDQIRAANDSENSLIASYGGWFSLSGSKGSFYSRLDEDSLTSYELQVRQRLRTVFIQ